MLIIDKRRHWYGLILLAMAGCSSSPFFKDDAPAPVWQCQAAANGSWECSDGQHRQQVASTDELVGATAPETTGAAEQAAASVTVEAPPEEPPLQQQDLAVEQAQLDIAEQAPVAEQAIAAAVLPAESAAESAGGAMYTLQLGMFSNPRGPQAYASQLGLAATETEHYAVQVNGQRMYVLTTGEYASLESAVAAAAEVRARLQVEVWPRRADTFARIAD